MRRPPHPRRFPSKARTTRGNTFLCIPEARMRRAALAGILVLVPFSALAAPAPERFDVMDANKDGFLSWQEFSAASSMTRMAFDMLDADKDGRISRQEWEAFTKSHGGRMDSGTAASPGMAAPVPSASKPGASGGLPLLTPPAMPSPGSTAQPKAGHAPNNTADLPLLTPPPAAAPEPRRSGPASSAANLPLLEPPKQ